MKIETSKITDWKVATKTKGLRAKPAVSLLVDRTVLNKFLVDPLEGKETLDAGAVICIGESNDAWQQAPKKLLQKYEVKSIDADGWMVCEPRPDNAVNCIEVTKELIYAAFNTQYPDERMYNLGDFAIAAQWGDNGYPQLGKAIQWGSVGDFICRNRSDHDDVWIVRRKIFVNTYSIKD